ncbi:hypothetical protein K469DRAFT_692155 [Zopfia rhizophila CBS 207.26]|uniref:Uncharacterized protein n=1 Tax=Zopfia rhizophila CBS 207.26 TaxID=1314779 RepID=A0A6A6DNY7_9PEZI|nr:hypothetical protein K469DRAFT_692155 [Zopfia rhizophila CBS 207.26]
MNILPTVLNNKLNISNSTKYEEIKLAHNIYTSIAFLHSLYTCLPRGRKKTSIPVVKRGTDEPEDGLNDKEGVVPDGKMDGVSEEEEATRVRGGKPEDDVTRNGIQDATIDGGAEKDTTLLELGRGRGGGTVTVIS